VPGEPTACLDHLTLSMTRHGYPTTRPPPLPPGEGRGEGANFPGSRKPSTAGAFHPSIIRLSKRCLYGGSKLSPSHPNPLPRAPGGGGVFVPGEPTACLDHLTLSMTRHGYPTTRPPPLPPGEGRGEGANFPFQPILALWPPSTGRITPVMNLASSETRNKAA
jgi:hypothetical protein